jgi:streptogramin lyase
MRYSSSLSLKRYSLPLSLKRYSLPLSLKRYSASLTLAAFALATAGCAGGKSAVPGALAQQGRALHTAALQQNTGASFVTYPTECAPALAQLANGPEGAMWFARAGGCLIGEKHHRQEYGGSIGYVTPSTGVVTEFLMGENSAPYSIAQAGGSMWIFDSTTYGGFYSGYYHVMYRFGDSGQTGGLTMKQGMSANAMATGPDGNLWYVGGNGHGGAYGTVSPQGVQRVHQFKNSVGVSPVGLTVGPDANVWFTDSRGGRLYRVEPSKFAKPAAFVVGGRPGWIVGTPSALVYSDQGTGQISVANIAGKAVVYPAPSGEVPTQLTVGIAGLIFFIESSTGGIGTFDPVTGIYGAESRPPNGASWLATGSDGNVWFDDPTGNVGAYLQYVLTTSPTTISFGSAGQSQTLTASETSFSGTFSATSANPAVATVTQTNASTFNVQAAGTGSTTIDVADSMGNAVNVPVTVGGRPR